MKTKKLDINIFLKRFFMFLKKQNNPLENKEVSFWENKRQLYKLGLKSAIKRVAKAGKTI